MTQIERKNLLAFFEYVDSTAAMTRKGFKKCTPIYLIRPSTNYCVFTRSPVRRRRRVDMAGTDGKNLCVLPHLGLRRPHDHRQADRF